MIRIPGYRARRLRVRVRSAKVRGRAVVEFPIDAGGRTPGERPIRWIDCAPGTDSHPDITPRPPGVRICEEERCC